MIELNVLKKPYYCRTKDCLWYFEGITFCHRYHFERLMATRSSTPNVIRLSGGAAKAKVWAQMFADVMKLPIETVSADEVGALGCAIGVAQAVGIYSSCNEAVKKMTRISGRYVPDPEAAKIYDRKYALYVKTIASLDSLWDDMEKFIEESK